MVFGLIGGLTSGEVELRTMPNQGIRQSAGYALRMLLLAPLLTLGVGLVAGTGLFLLGFLASPGRTLASLPGQPNGIFQAALLSLDFLPLLGVLLALTDDGDLLASVIGGWNAQVQLRDGTTGALLDTLEIENRHTFVGRLATGGQDFTLRLWDVDVGE
jgi:hypothetical protein